MLKKRDKQLDEIFTFDNVQDNKDSSPNCPVMGWWGRSTLLTHSLIVEGVWWNFLSQQQQETQLMLTNLLVAFIYQSRDKQEIIPNISNGTMFS